MTGKIFRLSPAVRASCDTLRQPAVLGEAYAKLPENIRALADKNDALLKENPRHPSLQLKKLGRFWSVRGYPYRTPWPPR
jgi:hypothetical protein